MKCPECGKPMTHAWQEVIEERFYSDTGAIEQPVREVWICEGCDIVIPVDDEIPY